MNAPRSLKSFRAPTEQERKVLNWIFEHGPEGIRSFLPQVEGIRVAKSCDCGCASMFLKPDDSTALRNQGPERIVAEFIGVTMSGDSILLFLFQDAGRLSELEIAPFDNFPSKSIEANFPKIESLKPN